MTIKEIGQRAFCLCRQDQRGAVASWGLLESDYYQPRRPAQYFPHFFHFNFTSAETSFGKKGKTGAEGNEESKSKEVGINLSTLAKLAEKKNTTKKCLRTNPYFKRGRGRRDRVGNEQHAEREASRSLVFYPQELQTDPGTLVVGLRKQQGISAKGGGEATI